MRRLADLAKCPRELFENFKFEKDINFPLPDIFQLWGIPLVSQKFKDALEAADPTGGHFFEPTLLFGKDGKPVSDRAFFQFFCGRVALLYENKERRALYRGDPSKAITEYQIFDNLERAQFLSKLPVWSRAGTRSSIYFSQEVFDALKECDLRGIDEYTQFLKGRTVRIPMSGQRPWRRCGLILSEL